MSSATDFGLHIDSFAGGGGASLGYAWACGRSPDIAINHDPVALAIHQQNHPDTKHFIEDVRKIDIRRVVGRRRVQSAWFSPDCKDFSRAKGDRPVSKEIRGLAWVVTRWCKQLANRAPDVVFLENVREFEEWGPLVPAWKCGSCSWRGSEGQAVLCRKRRRCPRCSSLRLRQTDKWLRDPARKGLTFRRWKGHLRNLGYHIEHRTINAADHGAPTHRRRLFLVARRDGQPIVWADATHGDPKKIASMPLFNILKPWRTAAVCIDWSLPCKSIFERPKPLATNTERRVAMAIKRYVLENPRPYIVGVGGRMGQTASASIADPSNTITSKNDRALVVPQIIPVTHNGDRRSHSFEEPMPTVTGAHRGELAVLAPAVVRIGQTGGSGSYAGDMRDPLSTIVSEREHLLVAPTLIQTGFGERPGQAPRVLDIQAPLGTVVAGGSKAQLVTAMLAKHYGGVVGQVLDQPIGTVTGVDHHSLLTASLVQLNQHCDGRSLDEPHRTITGDGNHSGLVAASLIRMNHGEKQWNGVDEPLVTITSGNHAALVYAFLIRYFGTAIGQHLTEPLYTITGKDRFGLVLVKVDGNYWAIVDILMRMLAPHELALAQGFPRTYIIDRIGSKKLPKAKQTSLIGNSVSPYPAAAIIRANLTGCLQLAS